MDLRRIGLYRNASLLPNSPIRPSARIQLFIRFRIAFSSCFPCLLTRPHNAQRSQSAIQQCKGRHRPALSPFFEAMFDLPQPKRNHSDEMFDGLDVIQVSENSRTLDMLLRFCYPAAVKDPSLEDLNDVEEVLEAAMKYGMEDVEERVRKTMVAPSLLENNSVHILAIACRYGLEPEARTAARYTLHHPAPTQDTLATALLPHHVIQGLATYRSRCSQAARTLCDNLDWLKQSQTHSFYEWWTNCCPCDSKADVRYLTHGTYPRDWWADYMDETSVALGESPCGVALTKNLAKAVERANSCPSCRRRAHSQMAQFTGTFARELDKVIAEITLDISI